MTEEQRTMYFRQGVRRLRDWMPSCRARALTYQGPMDLQGQSAVAAAQLPHIREKNLGALIISPGEKGGWHADLFMEGLPPGVANTLGSPVQSPFETREAAETFGKALLELALWKCHQNEKTPAPKLEEIDVVFELYGWSLRIPGSILSIVMKEMPDHAKGPYGTSDKAVARLRKELERQVPDGSYETYDFGAMPRERMIPLMAVLMGCALHGMFRYPPFEAKAPGEVPLYTRTEEAAP